MNSKEYLLKLSSEKEAKNDRNWAFDFVFWYFFSELQKKADAHLHNLCSDGGCREEQLSFRSQCTRRGISEDFFSFLITGSSARDGQLYAKGLGKWAKAFVQRAMQKNCCVSRIPRSSDLLPCSSQRINLKVVLGEIEEEDFWRWKERSELQHTRSC